MKIEIVIDKHCPEAKVIIVTSEVTSEINELVKRLSEAQPAFLLGYRDEKVELLQPETILRVYSDQQKVFAQTEQDTYSLRLRLYEAEEKLPGTHFIRISNSEIVNFRKVKNLDMSLNGTICIVFASGARSYVSRRYVAKIKNYLGI